MPRGNMTSSPMMLIACIRKPKRKRQKNFLQSIRELVRLAERSLPNIGQHTSSSTTTIVVEGVSQTAARRL